MNDQSKLMNPPQQRMQLIINPVQPRIMNQTPLLNQSHPVMQMNQQIHHHPLMMNPNSSSDYDNYGPNHSKMSRNNWKGKSKMHYNPQQKMGSYKPPTLNELQSQNRLKTRKFYPKKKRYVPYAPRNTTSFIIRAKKSGGITDLVSPCPVTPAVLPTPMFSPSREVLGDMAKEEWGVDGYGSMKGLIRLRSDGGEEDDEEEGGSSESDVEEHVEVERRLDHDLSRFEMIYPSNYGGFEYNNVLENRVDDQDSHIAQLEEENLTLKERLFLMERELGDMRRRLQNLERRGGMVGGEEVVENEFESEGDDTGGSDARTSGESKDICMTDVADAVKEVKDSKSNVDEAKEEKQIKLDGGNGFQEVVGEQCEEASQAAVGIDHSKAKLEDESENELVGEQGMAGI